MYRIIYIIIVSILFVSCEKNEFDEMKFGESPYDSIDVNDAITIKNVEVAEYFLSSNGVDTFAVKYFYDFDLNEKYFTDKNINNKKYEFSTELYVNDLRFLMIYDNNAKRYYIKEQFKYFKNRNNLMYFNLILYKDPTNPGKRKLGSNQFYFRVN